MKKEKMNRRQFIAPLVMNFLGFLFLDSFASSGQPFFEKNARPGLLSYIGPDGEEKRITTLSQWKTKRLQMLEGMQRAMGPLPQRDHLPGFDVQVMDEVREKTYLRRNISFTVAAGEKAYAYLYLPIQTGKRKRVPAILALHPTGALGRKIVDGQGPLPNRAYAKELAERGYVVIAPDYPGFGDVSDYNFETDRYLSGTMKSIFDNMRCIDLLQSAKEVDPRRIGVIGHSLGGHNALFTAAFDDRIKVAVSSCGWTLMDYYNAGNAVTERYGGRLGPWAQDRYMPLIRDKYHLDANEIPFDFDEVMALLAPRALFSNSPLNDGNFNAEGVRKGIAAVSEVFRFLNAKENLQVRYPDAQHDFPEEVRFEAYRFIDKIVGFKPLG